MECKEIPNLFVIGMPRSGTKLLRAILNNHSKIFIPDIEVVVIPRLLSRYGVSVLSEEDVNNVIRELKQSVFFFYYLKKSDFNFSNLKNGNSVREILSIMMQELAGSSNEYDFYGDKSPGNIDHPELLFSCFPKARFIHIVRDPRDYALSVNNAWGKSRVRAAVRWRESIQKFLDAADVFEDRVLEVRYEDLLESPAQTILRCTNFLGLNYEPDMIKLSTSVENLGDARSASIEKGNKGKYEKLMSPRGLRLIEDYTAPLLDYYGYPHSSCLGIAKKPPYFFLKLLSILDAITLIRFNIKWYGFYGGIRKLISGFRSMTGRYDREKI